MLQMSMMVASSPQKLTTTTNKSVAMRMKPTMMRRRDTKPNNLATSNKNSKGLRRAQRRPIMNSSSSSEPTNTAELNDNDDDELFTSAAITGSEGGENSGYGTYNSGSNYYGKDHDGSSNFGSSSSSYGNSAYNNYGGSASYGKEKASSSSIGFGGSTSTTSSFDSYDGGYSSSRYKSSSASSATVKSKVFTSHKTLPTITISVIPAIFFLLLLTLSMMLFTAHRMEHSPEGYFANCCRVLLNSVSCFSKLLYNLYYGRWGDIVHRMTTLGYDDEDDTMEDYTDEEMERMKLRPGIERALDVEHSKALRRVGIEMEKITKTKSKKMELGNIPIRK